MSVRTIDWAKKGGETHFDHKKHAKCSAASELMAAYEVTGAEAHDSSNEKSKEMIDQKRYRNHWVTDSRKPLNTEKNQDRRWVEHLFIFQTNNLATWFRIKDTGRTGFRRLKGQGVVDLLHETNNNHTVAYARLKPDNRR